MIQLSHGTFAVSLWFALNGNAPVVAQYGYGAPASSYTKPYYYTTTKPPPVNACPNITEAPYLYGEDYYRLIVELHANTSFNIAAIAKQFQNKTVSTYSPWNTIRQFADGGALFIGLIYGFVDNSDPQTCLNNAKSITGIIASIVARRNDFIPEPAGGGYLSGDAALECVVKQKGETTFAVQTIGAANVNATSPGPYLQRLIDIATNIARVRKVIATNDISSECQNASRALGETLLGYVRIDHTDAQIQSAYVFNTTTTTPYSYTYGPMYGQRPTPILYYR